MSFDEREKYVEGGTGQVFFIWHDDETRRWCLGRFDGVDRVIPTRDFGTRTEAVDVMTQANCTQRPISNFDTEQYAERAEAVEPAATAAASRKPRASTFGFYAYGDAPPAIGGGFGFFHWFTSRDTLLDYIAEHLTYENPGRHDTDPFAVHAAVQQAIEKYRTSKAPLKSLVQKLNPLLRTYSQLTWIGTFSDLKESNGRYERELRRDFRDRIESDKGSAPIRLSESAEFLEFLRECGI